MLPPKYHVLVIKHKSNFVLCGGCKRSSRTTSVIFFWSSGIMECTCMLFTFENGVLRMRQGASVVWHHSLLPMNSFNKTEAAVFSCRLCFLRAFPFSSLIFFHITNIFFLLRFSERFEQVPRFSCSIKNLNGLQGSWPLESLAS